VKRPAFTYLNPIKEYLLSQKTLEAWKALSMEARSLRIKQEHGIQIHRTHLAIFYK